MQKHGERWAALGPAGQQLYEARAAFERSAAAAALQERQEEALDSLALKRARLAEEGEMDDRPRLVLPSCQLSAAALAVWEGLYQGLMGK
eukprot:4253454-Alexandrium_andersonii.AAC.1